jgi:hypothetical protein
MAGKMQHHATPVAAAVELMAFQDPAHFFFGVLVEAAADPQLEVQVLPDFLHAEFREVMRRLPEYLEDNDFGLKLSTGRRFFNQTAKKRGHNLHQFRFVQRSKPTAIEPVHFPEKARGQPTHRRPLPSTTNPSGISET